MSKRPVAWRVKFLDGEWLLFQNQRTAYTLAVNLDLEMQGLYVRDGTPKEQKPDERQGEI